jgi:hypothetical protein
MRFLRSNTAVIVTVGPFYDKTDGVTIETALTITNERITLTADTDAGSAPTNILDNVTGATSGTANDLNYITGNDAGMMQLELAAADTNRVGRMFLSITDAANHVPVFHEFFVLPQAIYDWFTGVIVPLPANVTQLLGTAWLTPGTAGTPDVNAKLIGGQTASAAGAVTFPGTIASTTNITAAAGCAVSSIGADVITAASIATDAIGSAEISAAAVSKINGIVSGTSDSGTTTTMVDAARTEADTDYWKGALILFTSGTILGQCRLITGFNAATDTITFSPATTQAVGTQTYDIIPAGRVDLALLLGTAVSTPATAGILDVNVKNIDNDAASASGTVTFPNATLASTTNITAAAGCAVSSIGAAVITAASIAADAITDAKVAADVTIASVTGAVGSVTAGVTVAAGGIANTAFAAGAIDAAAIAADAITSSELAQSAAQEIADEILNRDLAGGGSGNTRNVRNALRALRNKVSETGGTLTVTQEDDLTPAWTAAVTRTASTDPITSVDPA